MGLTPIKLPYQSAKNRLFGVQPRISTSFHQIPTFNINDPYSNSNNERLQANQRNNNRRNGLPINMLVSHQRRISNSKYLLFFLLLMSNYYKILFLNKIIMAFKNYNYVSL